MYIEILKEELAWATDKCFQFITNVLILKQFVSVQLKNKGVLTVLYVLLRMYSLVPNNNM